MTFICVSILVEPASLFEAQTAAQEAAQNGAELIEWRIDQVADDPELIHTLIKNSPRPCIVTCRPTSQGGHYAGNEYDRLQLLESIAKQGHARYLDLELQVSASQTDELRQICASPNNPEQPTSLIISTHDFEKRPADLYRQVTTLATDDSAAVAKLAWHARSLRDNLQAFEILRTRTKPTIALCMGQFGLISRILAPKFGGYLTFASHDADSSTAPGQPTIDELLNLYHFRQINKSTKIFGILGWPVTHSQSPLLHNAGFNDFNVNAVYLPLPVAPEYEHFKATLAALLDDPHLDFCGASITIPHKKHLLRFAQEWQGSVEISPRAQEIGAANTLHITDQKVLQITNTDAPALLDSLTRKLNISNADLNHKNIAIIGAGGAARAAVAILARQNANLRIFNRTHGNAQSLAQEFAQKPTALDHANTRNISAAPLNDLSDFNFDILINTTSVGMATGPDPQGLPIPDNFFTHHQNLKPNTLFFDTVYVPLQTPLLQAAQQAGYQTLHGLDMLIRQAAAQFKIWTNQQPMVSDWQDLVQRTLTLR